MTDPVRDTKAIITEIGSVRLAVANDVGEIKTAVAEIKASCKPCRQDVQDIVRIVKGDNGAGHSERIGKLELRSKGFVVGVVLLVTFVSGLIATVVTHLL